MIKISYQHNNFNLTTLPKIYGNNKPLKFFIFGDSFAALSDYASPSWTVKVCDHFSATQYNWGIPGASEQSIFYTFFKTKNEDRDFTIIFHSHPSRTDKFFGLHNLPMNSSFYKKWDELITFPCLHLYWSESLYSFTNGKTLICSYPLDPPISEEVDSLHHLSDGNNFRLSQDIITVIEGMLINKR